MTHTILLADDSLTIQKVVELTFADTPYTVVAVSSGDELLAKISEVRPAVIICDILMPGRDGYDVCQDIKSNPDTLHIPVILLSGTFEPLDRNRALAVGCSEILAKPFEARKLIDTVERLARGQDTPSAAAIAELRPRDAETGPIAFDAAGGDAFASQPPQPADVPTTPAARDAAFAAAEFGEGLDFTKAGFDEFEIAARERAAVTVEPPRDGLDFDIGGTAIDPFSDLGEEPADAPGDGTFADAFNAGEEPFGDVVQGLDDSDVAGAVFGSAERAAPPSPPVEVRVALEAPERAPAVEPLALGDDHTLDMEAGPAAGPIDELAVNELDLAAAAVTVGAGSPFITDADTAPLPPITGPVATPADAVAGPAPAPAAGLSDEDGDRIARRLLELAHSTIEQIAWEVIPDVAEIMVRERIRQIEAESETEN
jgi:CheY-like chemotaxis protein